MPFPWIALKIKMTQMDNKKHYTNEEITRFVRYGAVLMGIHNRITMENYFLKDGKAWNIFKVGILIGEFEIVMDN